LNANTPVPCGLAALGRLRVPVEKLSELRRCPGPIPAEPLPASFLKHSDEQTVVGLAAVFQAIKESGLAPASFRDWGVMGAPRFLGRGMLGFHVTRFASEGAWGISPHLIPHRSLHAISGTVSQALKIRGPNFGVGGGPGSPTEALLNAAALLSCQHLPGLWVVLTAMDPETASQPNGQPTPGTSVLALALALVPWSATAGMPRLTVSVGVPLSEGGTPGGQETLALDRVMNLFDSAPGTTARLELDQGSWVEVAWPGSSLPPPHAPERLAGARLSSLPLPVETER